MLKAKHRWLWPLIYFKLVKYLFVKNQESYICKLFLFLLFLFCIYYSQWRHPCLHGHNTLFLAEQFPSFIMQCMQFSLKNGKVCLVSILSIIFYNIEKELFKFRLCGVCIISGLVCVLNDPHSNRYLTEDIGICLRLHL